MTREEYLTAIEQLRSQSAPQSSVSSVSTQEEERRRKRQQAIMDDIETYMSAAERKASVISQDYAKRYKSDSNEYRSDTHAWTQHVSPSLSGFTQDTNYVRKVLKDYGGELDKDYVGRISARLENASTLMNGISASARGDQSYWDSFGGKANYDTLLAQADEYNRNMSYDIEQGRKDIDAMEEALKKAKREKTASPLKTYLEKRDAGYGIIESMTGHKEWREEQGNAAVKGMGYDTYEEASAAQAENRKAYTSAKEVQTSSKLATAAQNDVNFAQYVAKGKERENDDSIWTRDTNIGYMRKNPDAMTASKAASYQNIFMMNERKNDKYYLAARQMSDDEYDIYAYYLGKGDIESANAYVDSIVNNLSSREAVAVAQEQDTYAEKMLFAVVAGLDQWQNGVRNVAGMIKGDETMPQSTTQIASSQVRESMNGLGRGTYDLVNTISNQIPNIAISYGIGAIGEGIAAGMATAEKANMIMNASSKIGSAVGAATMGTSVAGNAYSEMINAGYSVGAARTYAALDAASETLLQYFLGGISGLGEKLTSKSVESFAKGLNSAAARFAVEYGADMASEGIEEFLQDVLAPYIKSFATGEQREAIDWEEAIYSGLLGALSAGVMNVPSAIKTNQSYKSFYGDAQNPLIESGLASPEGTASRSMAEAAQARANSGKNVSGYALSYLADANEDAIISGDVASIKDVVSRRLSDLNETGNIDVLSTAIAKTIANEQGYDAGRLTKAENNAMSLSRNTNKVIRSLNPQTTIMDTERVGRQVGSLDYNLSRNNDRSNAETKLADASDRVIKGFDYSTKSTTLKYAPKALESKLNSTPATAIETARTTAESKVNSGTDKVTSSQNTVTAPTSDIVSVVAKNDDGTLSIKLKDGTVISSNDAVYRDLDEGTLYEYMSKSDYDTNTINAVINGYSANSGVSVDTYLLGMDEAITRGKYGYPMDAKSNGFYSDLTASQKSFGYSIGRRIATVQTQSAQNRVAKALETTDYKRGKVYFVNPETQRHLTERQKASVSAIARVVSETSNNKVIFYESVVNADGKRVLAEDVGSFKKGSPADNGFYNRKTGTIYIDINADNGAAGTMLWTFAHELTHFAKDWSPALYAQFTDFLMTEFSKAGADINLLVDNRLQQYKNAGRDITRDEAFDEVVANAVQTMFTDTNLNEKLSKLRQNNKTLFDKLKDFFKNLYSRITRAYNNIDPDTAEAQIVHEMGSEVQRISDEFAKVISDAGENFSTANLETFNTYTEAVSESGESLFNLRSMQEDETIYRNMLVNLDIMSPKEITELFQTIDAAMDIVQSNLDILDFGSDNIGVTRAFNPVKPNSDKLYKVSVDFSTLCRKRILQQTIASKLNEKLGRNISKAEGIAIRNELKKLQKDMDKIEVACALCYVESARMKSNKQINLFLASIGDVVHDYLAENGSKQAQQVAELAERAIQSKLWASESEEFKDRYADPMANNGKVALKKMHPDMKKAIQGAKKEAKHQHQLEGSLDEIVATAKTLPKTEFTTPEGLEDLARNHRQIFNAYASFIRNATHSKGFETDVYWKAGDSDVISDTLIAQMNKENGLRTQSWSDFQVIHTLDYIAMVIELSTRKAKMHGYTKVADYVRLMGMTGTMINMSLIPTAEYNGSLEFDPVEGMALDVALELREAFPDTAGTICIGIKDAQIAQLLSADYIDYVIPYHESGMSKDTRIEMHIPAWVSYQSTQNETKLDNASDIKRNADKYGAKKVLSKSNSNWHKSPAFSEWFNLEEAREIAKANSNDDGKHGVMTGAYVAMAKMADNYKRICAERGLAPKFSSGTTDFSSHEAYWKLLIDRKMINQKTGEIIEQKEVIPRFKQSTVEEMLNRTVEEYPEVKRQQDAAIKSVTEKFLAGEMNEDVENIRKNIKDVKFDDIVSDSQLLADLPAEISILSSTDEVRESVRTQEQESLSDLLLESDLYNNSRREFVEKYDELLKQNPSLNYFDRAISGDAKKAHSEFLGFIESLSEEQLKIYRVIFWKRAPHKDLSTQKGARNFESKAIEFTSDIDRLLNPKNNLRIENGRYSLEYVHNLFNRLNEDADLAKLADKVFKASERYGVDIMFGNDLMHHRNAAGVSRGDIIIYKTNYFNDTATSAQHKAETLIHELIHNITSYAIDLYTYEQLSFTSINRAAAKLGGDYTTVRDAGKALVDVYEEIKNEKSLRGEYGRKSPYEMVAELSSPAFVAKLKAINLFDKIVDAVCKLLGIKRNKSNSAYDSVYSALVNLMEKGDVALQRAYAEENRKKMRLEGNDKYIPSGEISPLTGLEYLQNAVEEATSTDNIPSTPTRTAPNEDTTGVVITPTSGDATSARTLLTTALESVAQNDAERQMLAKYRAQIDKINTAQARLAEVNAKIRELSFAKGKRDVAQLTSLHKEANQLTEQLNKWDRELLRLEASKPLKDLLAREKKAAKDKATSEYKKALEEYRKQSLDNIQKLRDAYKNRTERNKERQSMTKLRHEIRDAVSKINDLLLNGTKDRHIPLDLQSAAVKALSAVNMDTVSAERRLADIAHQMDVLQDKIMREADITKLDAYNMQMAKLAKSYAFVEAQGEKMAEKLNALKAAYASINTDAYDPTFASIIDKVIEEVGDTPLRDMNLSQLTRVRDLYKGFLKLVTMSNEAFRQGRRESISELANTVAAELAPKMKDKRPSIVNRVSRFMWSNLKPVYAFKMLGSKTLESLFMDVRKGEDVWISDMLESRTFYRDMARKYNIKAWDTEAKYDFTTEEGQTFSLSLEEMMSLYAYSKRKQAHAHLTDGGILLESDVITEKKHGVPIKYDVNNATPYKISDAVLGEIIERMQAEAPNSKDYVDEMQTFLSKNMGEKGNEVSRALYDFELFGEENYFPLKVSSDYLPSNMPVNTNEAPQIKNMSFTKPVAENAQKPIVLQGFTDVWSKHCNDMSLYHGFTLPLEDFNRVLHYTSRDSVNGYTSVPAIIKSAGTTSAYGYIEQLLRDLNGGVRADVNTNPINRLIGLWKKSAVLASASVVVQQPASIARAWAYIDPKYFGKSTLRSMNVKEHNALWDEVKQYAPVASIKEMGYFDTHLGRNSSDWITEKQYDTIGERAKALIKDSAYRDEVLALGANLADEYTWVNIWEAVKAETAALHPEYKVGSEDFLRFCGDRFTEVIINTQVYDSVLSRSQSMRSPDTGVKMATAFMSEPLTSLNMLEYSAVQFMNKDYKGARNTVASVVASSLLASIMVSFIYAARDDDDDKSYTEKYLATLTGELRDANVFNLVPYLKDIVSLLKGYDVERSDMTVISDLVTGVQSLGKGSLNGWQKVEKFGGSIASVFGIPLKNFMRDLRSAYNVAKDIFDGHDTTAEHIGMSIREEVSGESFSSQYKSEILDALEGTDMPAIKDSVDALIAYKLEQGKSEKDAKSDIKSTITSEYKSRYYEAYKANNTDEMRRIREVLNATKLYDDVVKTVQQWVKDSAKKDEQ